MYYLLKITIVILCFFFNTINVQAQNDTIHSAPVYKSCIDETDIKKQNSCNIKAMMHFFQRHFIAPKSLYDSDISVKTYVNWVVDSLGRASSPVLLYSSGNSDMDNEILRIIGVFPNAIVPAKTNGKSIHTSYIIPVNFKGKKAAIKKTTNDSLASYTAITGLKIRKQFLQKEIAKKLFQHQYKYSTSEAENAFHNTVSALQARGINTVVNLEVELDASGKILTYKRINSLHQILDYSCDQIGVQLIGKQFDSFQNKKVNIKVPIPFLYNCTPQIDYHMRSYYFQQALFYYHKKRYKKAIKEYNKSIEIDAEYADAYYNRAHCYLEMNDASKACEDFKKAASLGDIYSKGALQKHCNDLE